MDLALEPDRGLRKNYGSLKGFLTRVALPDWDDVVGSTARCKAFSGKRSNGGAPLRSTDDLLSEVQLVPRAVLPRKGGIFDAITCVAKSQFDASFLEYF